MEPTKADSYTITASFVGDDSYGSSSAGTDLTVGASPATATPIPTQTQQTLPPIETYFAISTIAIIIAIAVIGMLILRKR